MTPPDRRKRPSARRSSLPPPPEARTPERQDAAAQDGAATSTDKPKGKKGRVAARRPSMPPPSVAAKPEAASPREERTELLDVPPVDEPTVASTAAASQAAPVASPAEKGPVLNGNGVHASPALSAPARLAVAEPIEVPVDVAHDEVDDDDIWSEGGAVAPVGFEALADAQRVDESARERDQRARGEESAKSSAQGSRLARSRRDRGERDEAVRLGSAQTLLSTDYYFRQYGAHGIRSLSAEVDDFGLDPHAEERARPVLEALCKHYFRVDVDGAQHLPDHGRLLMVCNRAGTLPWDGLVLRTALRMARPTLQPVRWLAEDSVFHTPFLGVFMNRLGAVRACPENAERLLAQDRLVAVFPEGAHGSSKLFKDRYRLQRFGRGGYVKLALKLGAPIVPTAIIGAEEANPLLAKSKLLGRAIGASFMPITPTFPWLGPAGLVPAPVKWRIVVGEPIDLSSYGPKAEGDALVVHRLNEQIRALLQSLVDQAKSSRRSVLFG